MTATVCLIKYERRQVLVPHYPHPNNAPCDGLCGGFSSVEEIVVPVQWKYEPDQNGNLRPIHISELKFPLKGWATSEVNGEIGAAIEDGYRASPQYNDRMALQFVDVQTTRSGEFQPILQPASMAPMLSPYIRLDSKAWEVHARDEANSFGGCDNPWVPELFAEPKAEDGSEAA